MIPLSFAFSEYDHIRDLAERHVAIEGAEVASWENLDVPELFARFAKKREWDVSEYGMGKYVAQRAAGDSSITALPVFPSRMFRTSAFYVRADSRMSTAADLRGATVGIPEWAQTACIWARGWLAEEQDVDLRQIAWVRAGVDEPGRDEKVALFLPDGLAVTSAPETSLNDLLLSGAVDAVLSAEPPRCVADGRARRLYADPQAIEADYFRRTGILPIMHLVAVRREITEAHPGIAGALFAAFEEAKHRSVERVRDWKASRVPIVWGAQWADAGAALFDGEYWPYGIEPNRRPLEAFLRFAGAQGVLERPITVEELFEPGLGA